MWIRWALSKSPRIYRSAGVYFVYVYLCGWFLSACMYVCICVCKTPVSVLPSVGFLVKRAHKCLTDRAAVFTAPRGIIEETLMYIANYQKWQNSSYTRSSGSTYVSSRTIKNYAGWYCMFRKNATERERKLPIRSLFSVAPVKSPRSRRMIPNYIY